MPACILTTQNINNHGQKSAYVITEATDKLHATSVLPNIEHYNYQVTTEKENCSASTTNTKSELQIGLKKNRLFMVH